MSTHIKFYGIAAFEVTLPDGRVVLIDPCLEENPASPVKVADLEQVDLLLITHLAVDHKKSSITWAARGSTLTRFARCRGTAR